MKRLLFISSTPILFFIITLFAKVQLAEVRVDGVLLYGNDYNISGKRGIEFLGIPYAEPPVKDLRFAKPIPLLNKWRRSNLTEFKSRCHQPAIKTRIFEYFRNNSPNMIPKVDEDCLYLNIWKPVSGRNATKAVMVWIHGGFFYFGDSYPSYNGRALAVLGDVVVVTLNYRVGVLGFLRLDDSVAGNWGLWDQQLALKWVKENIAAFNGNPSAITLFGQSAGAASVSLHLLNSESVQYFERAIVQSGAATANWAANPNADVYTTYHRRFASLIGCNQRSTKSILECLRRQNPTVLTEKGKTFINMDGFVVYWQPVVDGDFLKQAPTQILAEGKMAKKDIIMGVTEDEGGSIVHRLLTELGGFFKMSIDDMKKKKIHFAINYMFYFYPYFPKRMHPFAISLLKSDIISNDDPTNGDSNVINFNRACTYAFFVCPANYMADSYAEASNAVYYYQFYHRQSISRYPPYVGATHTDENDFIFGMNFVYPLIFPFTSEERNLSVRLIEEWSTFAKTGKPKSSNWKPFTPTEKEYFILNLTSYQKSHGINRLKCVLWNDLLPLINEIEPSYCYQFTLTAKVLLGFVCLLFLSRIVSINYSRIIRKRKMKNKGVFDKSEKEIEATVDKKD